MAETTAIPWAEASWNPWIGCTPVSRACDHCYMMREQRRWGKDPTVLHVTSDKTYLAPLKWSPRRIFACSWSDFFHPAADVWRKGAWDIIRETPQHRYLILTKRPGLVRERLPVDWHAGGRFDHVWLGVTVEEQAQKHRIHKLANAQGTRRRMFVSAEPLLGPLSLEYEAELVDWLIVGGETGPGARHPNPEWVWGLSEWAMEAGVPYFFKRWGAFRGPEPRTLPCERREMPAEVQHG